VSYSYTSRILCRLCGHPIHATFEGDPTWADEDRLDQDLMRQALCAGIVPVDLPHVPSHLPKAQRRPWICTACSGAILRAITIQEDPRA